MSHILKGDAMLQLDLKRNKNLIQNQISIESITKFESSCVAYSAAVQVHVAWIGSKTGTCKLKLNRCHTVDISQLKMANF